MPGPDRLSSVLQQHHPKWSLEENVSSPERYVPGGDLERYAPDAEQDEGPSGPKEEAPSQGGRKGCFVSADCHLGHYDSFGGLCDGQYVQGTRTLFEGYLII